MLRSQHLNQQIENKILSEEKMLNRDPERASRTPIARDTVLMELEKKETAYKTAQKNHEEWRKAFLARESKQDESDRKSNKQGGCIVRVIKSDWGDAALDFARATGQAPTVLCMSSSKYPGGDWCGASGAQEENMVRRTPDLLPSLINQDKNDTVYKYSKETQELLEAKHGVVGFYPTLVCVKGPEAHQGKRKPVKGYENNLDNYFLFNVVAAAADNLSAGKDKDENPLFWPFNRAGMKAKIRAIFETAKKEKQRNLILSAFGCGAYNNPAEEVAEIFAEILTEYKDDFDYVDFSIFFAGWAKENFCVFANRLDKLFLEFYKVPTLFKNLIHGKTYLSEEDYIREYRQIHSTTERMIRHDEIDPFLKKVYEKLPDDFNALIDDSPNALAPVIKTQFVPKAKALFEARAALLLCLQNQQEPSDKRHLDLQRLQGKIEILATHYPHRWRFIRFLMGTFLFAGAAVALPFLASFSPWLMMHLSFFQGATFVLTAVAGLASAVVVYKDGQYNKKYNATMGLWEEGNMLVEESARIETKKVRQARCSEENQPKAEHDGRSTHAILQRQGRAASPPIPIESAAAAPPPKENFSLEEEKKRSPSTSSSSDSPITFTPPPPPSSSSSSSSIASL